MLVEALIALCYRIAGNAYGVRPETPVRTFSVLVEKGLMNAWEFEELVKLVRLRNLLIHRYWVVDDRRVYDSVRKDFKAVREFLERVKRELGF